MSDSKSLFKSAKLMALGVMLSRITGLVREQVFAVLFGASIAMDAFQIAFRIPNLLRDLFAEGALSQAFVPEFQKVRLGSGEYRGKRLLSVATLFLVSVVSILSILGAIFAPELVEVYAPSFKQTLFKYELTVTLTRLLFGFFPFISLAALWMAALNATGSFFIPAVASAVFNITSIVTGLIGVWICGRIGMEPILGMAFGVVLGGAAQAFVQWPALRARGYRLWEKRASDDVIPLRNTQGLSDAARLMVPGFFGLAATQINILITSVLATSFGHGAVSWLSYAFRLMQLPVGLFGVSLGSASLAKVSEMRAGKVPALQVRAMISDTLVRSLFLNLSATAGLLGCSQLLIGVLFQYGAFLERDSVNTALALEGYALGLAGYSLVKVLAPTAYALGRVRVTVVASFCSIFISLGFSFAFKDSFGFSALAYGTALGAWINAMVLGFSLREFLDGSKLLRAVAKNVPAGIAAVLVMHEAQRLTQGTIHDAKTRVFVFLWVSGLGVVSLGIVGYLTGVSECRQIVSALRASVRNKFSQK